MITLFIQGVLQLLSDARWDRLHFTKKPEQDKKFNEHVPEYKNMATSCTF